MMIQIEDTIRQHCPDLRLGMLRADVRVGPSPEALIGEIAQACAELEQSLSTSDIGQRPAIAATRQAYKALGKEPSRYRPSAEALTRRVVQGKGLYQVSNVVDLLNLVSIRTGFSIGGWDADQIQGTATLGIGTAEEPYEAIGRGPLNIEFFPVFRDEQGAFGTPTSDSERTMVRPDTSRFLMGIYAFGGDEGLNEAMDLAQDLLRRFAGSTSIQTAIV